MRTLRSVSGRRCYGMKYGDYQALASSSVCRWTDQLWDGSREHLTHHEMLARVSAGLPYNAMME